MAEPTLPRIVRAFQRGAGLVTASFVILLFVNEPAKLPAAPPAGTADAGRSIYATRCAGCHGADGGGGFGSTLSGGVVVERFPNAADEIAVVTGGRGSMPAFAGSLTDEQIAAVVEFTRSGLP